MNETPRRNVTMMMACDVRAGDVIVWRQFQMTVRTVVPSDHGRWIRFYGFGTWPSECMEFENDEHIEVIPR